MNGVSSEPVRAPVEGELPTALTFFVTVAQRRAILKALKRIDRDRTRALRIAALQARCLNEEEEGR